MTVAITITITRAVEKYSSSSVVVANIGSIVFIFFTINYYFLLVYIMIVIDYS